MSIIEENGYHHFLDKMETILFYLHSACLLLKAANGGGGGVMCLTNDLYFPFYLYMVNKIKLSVEQIL